MAKSIGSLTVELVELVEQAEAKQAKAKRLWHKIPPWRLPREELLLVDFGPGGYPAGIELVSWSSGMFWIQDEGQWKGVGTEGTEAARRWCRLDDALTVIGKLEW